MIRDVCSRLADVGGGGGWIRDALDAGQGDIKVALETQIPHKANMEDQGLATSPKGTGCCVVYLEIKSNFMQYLGP